MIGKYKKSFRLLMYSKKCLLVLTLDFAITWTTKFLIDPGQFIG